MKPEGPTHPFKPLVRGLICAVVLAVAFFLFARFTDLFFHIPLQISFDTIVLSGVIIGCSVYLKNND